MPHSDPVAQEGEAMLNTRDASEVLNRDFLEARSKILEIAAILDRIDRAPSKHHDQPDARMSQLRQAIDALSVPDPGRAETIQLIFSLEYNPKWSENMSLPRAGSSQRRG
jgi:hypothetical protein